MNRFINYLKDTRAEFVHVSFPTQRQTIIYTLLVIGISIFAALYLGFADFLFSKILQTFVLR
jgi:preprotein translocase SecE subunit